MGGFFWCARCVLQNADVIATYTQTRLSLEPIYFIFFSY